MRIIGLLGVSVARNDARVDTLSKANEHPSGGSALRMTGKVLLSDDRDSVARSTGDSLEHVVIDAGLILVVGLGARAMDRDDACARKREYQR